MILKALVLGTLIHIPQDWHPVYDPDFISLDCEQLGSQTWIAYDWANDQYAFDYG